jgi:hypothetical protein
VRRGGEPELVTRLVDFLGDSVTLLASVFFVKAVWWLCGCESVREGRKG